MIRHLEKFPLSAWAKEKSTGRQTFFKYQNGRFASTFSVADELRVDFQELTRELVEWRLAEYLQRPNVSNPPEGQLVCRVIHANQRPIIKLPDRKKVSGIPDGWTDVLIDGQPHEANFAKQFVNVVRVPGSKDNVLADMLRGWFGPNAGMPGTRFEVVFKPTEAGYTMSKSHSS